MAISLQSCWGLNHETPAVTHSLILEESRDKGGTGALGNGG